MYTILCWLTSKFQLPSILPWLLQTSIFTTPSDQTSLLPTPFSRSFMNALKSARLSGDLMKGIADHTERAGKVHPVISLLGGTQNSEPGVSWPHVGIIPAFSSSLQPRELQRSLSNLYYAITVWLVPNATFTQSTQRVIKTSHYCFVLCPYDHSNLTRRITATVMCNGWMVHRRVLIFFFF